MAYYYNDAMLDYNAVVYKSLYFLVTKSFKLVGSLPFIQYIFVDYGGLNKNDVDVVPSVIIYP